MTKEEYIERRLDGQISWYDEKSKQNKFYHIISKTSALVFAAVIPFLTAFLTGERLWLILPISICAVLTAIATGISTVFKFQEKWNEYRTTCETLKHEKYLFLTLTRPYGGDESNDFNFFVKRVETLISKENSNWQTYIDKDESFY